MCVEFIIYTSLNYGFLLMFFEHLSVEIKIDSKLI